MHRFYRLDSTSESINVKEVKINLKLFTFKKYMKYNIQQKQAIWVAFPEWL